MLSKIANNKFFKPLVAGFALVMGVVFFTNWSVTANYWITFSTVFLGIFIEALPFLLLGTLSSGLVEVFLDQEKIQKFIPSSPVLGALAGSLFGLIFPVCECGVVPLVRRLFRKGLPIPAGIAFLLAAPVINPIVIVSTITAFGFGKVVFFRIGISLFTAIMTGIVFSTVKTPWEILLPTAWITPDTGDHDHNHNHGSEHIHEHDDAIGCSCNQVSYLSTKDKLVGVFQVTLDEFFEIGRFLIIGSMIAAAMQTFIPQSTLLEIGKGPVLSVVVMISLAILLSICSTVDAFVALGFAGTFSTGSILAFLSFGPMVDIKSIILFLRILRPKPVIYLVVIPLLIIFLITVSMNMFMI
jgi:uncharacterized membrane protein YraQ (UPF0718 family)